MASHPIVRCGASCEMRSPPASSATPPTITGWSGVVAALLWMGLLFFAQLPSSTENRLNRNTWTPRTRSHEYRHQDGGTPWRDSECSFSLAEVCSPMRQNSDNIGIDLARPLRGHGGHGEHSLYATRVAMQFSKTRGAGGAHWEPQEIHKHRGAPHRGCAPQPRHSI